VLDPSHVTLAEVLKGAGYVTCGFVEAPFLTADMGFGRGFDSFTRLPYKKGKQTPQTWLQWIKKNQRNKFFLFIHTYNVHQAYSSPAPYNTLYDPGYSGTITGRVKPLVNNDSLKAGYAQDPELSKNDLRHLIALYDGGIRYNDVIMESLIAELQRLGLYDRSLIVITADHGDAFYEHKIFGHYKLLYNEVLKVPLIIKFPHGHFHNRRVACQVRSIDIMPTILEVVGTAARGNLQGEGLLNLLAAADSPGACDRIAFSDVHIDHRRGKRILAVQTGHYKYIRLDNSSDPAPGSVQEELYDVRTDPGETHNLIPGERAIRDFMKSMVEEYMEQERAHAPSAWGPAYDKAAVEQLRDLGYMQ
jgi:arylsulfatase A-like enzyme